LKADPLYNEAILSKEGIMNQISQKEFKLKAHERKIGQYILGKTIGEGTFGKVKIGMHILTKNKVAVKILEKSKIVDVADVERVSREIHILKIVQHP
jgi:serine/threonine protein kinase